MQNWLTNLFNSDDFLPHGHCFMWLKEILWLHVISDAVIGLSYFSIPVAILYFARRRKDIPFRYIFALFGAFIILCGSTHFFSIWVLWHPDYGPEGIVKALTAVVSALTAVIVWRILPAALTLPSPSELHEMNIKLKETNLRIEQEVVKRTAELQAANEQLHKNEAELQLTAQKAESASKAKSEFLAHMSHELRTPMNAVIGLTSYLAHSNLTPRQMDCVRTMAVSAEALMGLLNDLLDISRIEAGSIELEDIPFNLGEIVDNAMTIIAPRAREKQLALNLNAPAAFNQVLRGDPLRIQQILTNLLGNAVKFTASGSVTLQWSVTPIAVDRAAVAIDVIDTGIGIAADHFENIFKTFTQADTSIQRLYGGSGLGLAITEQLVNKMNGKISVESQPDKGSHFSVVLQMPIDKDMAKAKQIPETPQRQLSDAPSGHILIVEDWQPNAMVMKLLLEKLGYTYDVASTGANAIEFFISKIYNAVLMDIKLPDISGHEVTQRIRAFERDNNRPRTPIIATTAYAMSDDRDKCLQSGMDAYLSKPLDERAVIEVLKELTTLRATNNLLR